MQTQGAIGNLINRYRAVLKKCRLLNVFGSLAVAGLLVMGGAGAADARNTESGFITADDTITNGVGTDATEYDTANQTKEVGGVFYLKGSNLTVDGGTYSGNSVTTSNFGGGAIFAGQNTTLNITSSSEAPIVFEQNSANSFGGAVYINKNANASIYNAKFTGNTVSVLDSTSNGGGGALLGAEGSTLTVTNSIFDSNSAVAEGGAIRADGTLDVQTSTFTGNHVEGNGGAIGTATSTSSVKISDSTFTGNSASLEGGAVYISSTSGATLELDGINTFSGNTDQDGANDITSANEVKVVGGETDLQGGYKQAADNTSTPSAPGGGGQNPSLTVASGAMLSAASMTLGTDTADGGTVTVASNGVLGNGTANMAELKAAIEEAKTNGVDTTAGAYVGKASLDLSKAGLAVGDGASAATGEANFAAGSALLADQSALNGAAAFTGVTTATLADTAQVHVQNAVAGQSLTLFDNDNIANNENTATVNVTDSQGQASSIQITSDNRMVEFGTLGTDGTATSKAADVSSALPGLSGELGALATNFASVADRSQRGQVFWANALDPNKMSAKDAVTTIESAARIAAVSAVPQMTWAAQKAASAAVTQRTSLSAPASAGLQAVAADGSVQTGAAAGDAMKNGFAMWIMPLYQSWNAWGLEGGNLDMDVHGGLGGLAVGADYTFDHAFRAGITVNMGGGYAEGSGDFNKTTNNFTFWGLGAYLGWSKNNVGLTADINHTWDYNDVEQDLAASMQMDSLKSDITSRALSAGLRGEYKLETDALDITPHVGVRYTYLTTDKYDVESGNATVLEGDTIHQGIWTFPIGVAFSKDVQMDSGWYVKPALDLAVVPAAGDIKARGDVRFTGVPGSAEMSTQTMDYITYMGQAGLEFGNDNVKLGVNYNLQMGAQSTAHGVFGTLRYEF
ncbi:MAG: autotransporter domain-containing protein [Desulfovibrio sp.]|nr:autotransporter domain-containing protein [Desulfovibrio sp.]